MNEKEKAKELMRKYLTAVSEEMLGNDSVQIYTAKQCAIICCDEIMEASIIKLADSHSGKFVYTDEYWNQVKQEINKM